MNLSESKVIIFLLFIFVFYSIVLFIVKVIHDLIKVNPNLIILFFLLLFIFLTYIYGGLILNTKLSKKFIELVITYIISILFLTIGAIFYRSRELTNLLDSNAVAVISSGLFVAGIVFFGQFLIDFFSNLS